MTTVKRFEKDGKNVWESKSESGFASAALQVEAISLTESGTAYKSSKLFWIRAEADILETVVSMYQKQLESGVKVLITRYSKTPFYVGQNEAINPKTGELLGRYDRIECVSANLSHLDKTYVDNSVDNSIVIAKNEAITEEFQL